MDPINPFTLPPGLILRDYVLPMNEGRRPIQQVPVIGKNLSTYTGAELDALMEGLAEMCLMCPRLPQSGPTSNAQNIYFLVEGGTWIFTRFTSVSVRDLNLPNGDLSDYQDREVGLRCFVRFWPDRDFSVPDGGFTCGAYDGWVIWANRRTGDFYRFYVIRRVPFPDKDMDLSFRHQILNAAARGSLRTVMDINSESSSSSSLSSDSSSDSGSQLTSSGVVLLEHSPMSGEHLRSLHLQLLEGAINYKWNALLVEQRDGVNYYISEVIAKILKDDRSARWQSFIPDLVTAAKTNETFCKNCMAILKLLSEEVFGFSKGEMTQQKIKKLKQSLNSESQLIHALCLYALSASQRTELIRATLDTLHAILSWILRGYIFESPLTIFPLDTNISETYANGSSDQQAFIKNLALFFMSIFKVCLDYCNSLVLGLFEAHHNSDDPVATGNMMGLQMPMLPGVVDDLGSQLMQRQVCSDYLNSLVLELFEAHHTTQTILWRLEI